MQKNIFMSYSARYKKSTEKQIKLIEKFVLSQIIKDADYAKKLLTTHQFNSNKNKAKKIIKLLILNLIRAVNNNSELIVSMDKNTLREHDINLRLYSGIIEKLYRMDLINIRKGFFIGADNLSKRTRISATETLKNIIIKYCVEYTEQYKVKLNGITEHGDKVKLIFKDVQSDKTFAKFFHIEDKFFETLSVDNIYIITVDNIGRIKEIKR